MSQTYKLKQGDLQRSLRFFIEAADGTPVPDLASAVSRVFSMRPAGGETNKITGRAVNVIDAVNAEVEIDLTGTDTDTPGLFIAEILVEWAAGEYQTFPGTGHIEIYIEADLTETTARTRARQRLEAAARTAQDPALDASEVAGILDRAQRADTVGRAPDAAGWVETYDVDAAIVEAWEAKAAEAACRVEMARGTLRINRQQIMTNCLRMAALHRSRRTSSTAMTAPNGRPTEGVLVANGPDSYLDDGVPGAGGHTEWGDGW